MSRPLRIQYKDAWYHVMNRGRRNEKVFWEPEDYYLFLELLKDSSIQWGVNVTAYCLMPNHYHLMVQTPLANLSRFMRHIDGVYTQRFNRKHKLDGQLFRGRFKSVIAGEDNYLLELLRYIHFNPVKAGMVEKVEDYEWSSFRAYQKKDKKTDWLYKHYLFRILGLKENYKSVKYINEINKDASEDIYDFFSRGNLKSILGSSDFHSRLKDKINISLYHQEIPESKDFSLDFKTIVDHVSAALQTPTAEILKVRRGRRNEARDIAIYLCRQLTQSKLTDIGKYFNNPKYSAISSAVNRIKNELQKREKLSKKVLLLMTELDETKVK